MAAYARRRFSPTTFTAISHTKIANLNEPVLTHRAVSNSPGTPARHKSPPNRGHNLNVHTYRLEARAKKIKTIAREISAFFQSVSREINEPLASRSATATRLFYSRIIIWVNCAEVAVENAAAVNIFFIRFSEEIGRVKPGDRC